jgi:hypothetical protein
MRMLFSGLRRSWPRIARNRLARPVDALGVTADGLGERLIDRLVKAGDVVDVVDVGLRKALAPEAQDAGAQGAVFGDDLDDIESRGDALPAVPCRGVVEPGRSP